MKALFYTATAVFIALAGIIAYFALQSPASVGSARIVLDIDIAGMPQAADESAARAPLDPYANEKDENPADSGEQPAPREGQPSHSGDAGALPGRDDHPESHSAPRREAQQEEIPAPPPGTALAGLEQDRPIFREVEPEGQAAPEPHPGADPAPAEQAAKEEFVLPGTNVDLPPSSLSASERHAAQQPADVTVDTIAGSPTMPTASSEPSAAPHAEAFAPAPVLPPPPVPARRPNDIAGPGERAAAADSDLTGGVQFATTEVSAGKEARVAILLRGVGRNERDGAAAIAKLPSAVSLGFLPNSATAQRFATQARDKGHEIIIQIPLEPTDYPTSDPGPDAMMTSLTPEENAARLDTVLTRFQGYTGVTNYMGGKMLQSKTALKPLLEDIKGRGLVYVGESNNSSTAVRQLAGEISLRYGGSQVLIDANSSPDAIDKALQRLVDLARQQGSAIGMGTAKGVTIEQVERWSQKLAAQGITLVPVGALAQTPGSSEARAELR
jgi:polysaccharide deacetylase 2 family uncharacterized protein YibQ